MHLTGWPKSLYDYKWNGGLKMSIRNNKALKIFFVIALVAFLATLPALALNQNAQLDKVVFRLGDCFVVVDLVEYAEAFDLDGDILWEYLKDGNEFPEVYAVASGDKYMDLEEYASNYVDDVGEAISNTAALPSSIVQNFKVLTGFDEDDNPILVPIDDVVWVTEVEELAAIEVIKGTDFADIGLPSEVEVTLDDDSTDMLEVDWDEGDYDGNIPGDYDLEGDLVLKEGQGNPCNKIKAEITVTVVESKLEVVSVEAVTDTATVNFGTSLDGAIAALNAQTEYEGVVEDEDNVELDIVDWASATYGPDKEGSHSFTGTAQAPAGYEFGAGVDTDVTATLTVGDEPDDEVIKEIQHPSLIVERGTEKDDINFPATVNAKANDTWYSIEVDWDDESNPVYSRNVPGEYVFEGELVDLPDYVVNTDNLKAEFTVEVSSETVFPDTEFVDTWQKFQRAVDMQIGKIIVTADIELPGMERIGYDLELDLDGNRLTLVDTLAFEGDDIVVENGAIFGNLTWWSWEGPGNPDDWNVRGPAWGPRYPSDAWQYSSRVMISGSNVTFENVDFHVDIADWYQTQEDKTAEGLEIRDSALHGVSLFNSDVLLESNVIANRVGIENDGAVLVENMFVDASENVPAVHPLADVSGLYGSVYVNADARLQDNTWADNFTGMFVGKSLKYYGTYSEAKPTLDGATIITDKYGLVWWALNYHKAELKTTGIIDISSDQGGPGLILVGTDYREPGYGGPTIPGPERPQVPGDFVLAGGKISGDAIFTGADVWIGKPTVEFLEDKDDNYRGPYDIPRGADDKDPVCLEEVDYQVCFKDADKLHITGVDFTGVDVSIFTPSNDYVNALLEDSVWFGDVVFGDIKLWGDFKVIRDATVTFDEIEVMCGNIRRIGTQKDLEGEKETGVGYVGDDFTRGGTITGGNIISDTKRDNVLVFGDGLLVYNVTLSEYLYNIILETAKLKNVDIYVGDSNRNDDRVVDGYTLVGDVFVWEFNHAIFEDVMWSEDTDVVVRNDAKLTFAGEIDNQGGITFETFASIGFCEDNDPSFTETDPRDGHSTEISVPTDGYAYIDVEKVATPGWTFEDWKNDVIIGSDARMISAIYQFRVYSDAFDEEYRDYYFDLRDSDNYPWVTRDGIDDEWLTVILGEDRDFFGKYDITVRIGSMEDKTFDLSAAGWMLNCCTVPQIELGDHEREVSVTAKPGVFPEGAYFLPSINVPNVVTQFEITAVNYTVTNIGDATGIQDVTWRVIRPDGSVFEGASGTTPDVEIDPSGTVVVRTYNWDPQQLGIYYHILITDDATYEARVEVVAPN